MVFANATSRDRLLSGFNNIFGRENVIEIAREVEKSGSKLDAGNKMETEGWRRVAEVDTKSMRR